jgi:hypothetical protein
MPNEVRAFGGFMDFALGINSVSGDIRGQAVTRTPAAAVPNADGQTVIFHVHSVTSTEDIKKALGVSAEVSAAFIGGGGSASFDFAESSNIHSFSSFLLVSSNVTNASTHMLNEEILPVAAALVAAGQSDRFREEFGDRYIKGIETGGAFFAIIEVQTTDSTDQTNVAASLSVEAFIGGAEQLKSHFNSSNLSSLSTHHLDINSLQVGGQAASAQQFTTADQMLDAAAKFATTVHDHPVAYRVELQDYQSLNLPPPPNAADIQNAKDVLSDCASRREAWLRFRNDIAFTMNNPTQFETPASDLSALDGQAAKALNTINLGASACLNDLKACKFSDVAEPDRSKLPNRKAGTASKPDGVWRPDDNTFDVSQLEIVSTGPGQANVIVTFRHGQNAPIVKSTTATLDNSANMYRSPNIVKQLLGVEHLRTMEFHRVAFSNAIVGNTTTVIQTVVGDIPNDPHPLLNARHGQPDINLTAVFRRQL